MTEGLSSDAERALVIAKHVLNDEQLKAVPVRIEKFVASELYTTLLGWRAAGGALGIIEGRGLGELDSSGLPISEGIFAVVFERLKDKYQRIGRDEFVEVNLSYRELDSLGRAFLAMPGTAKITGAYLFLNLNEAFVDSKGRDNKELRVKFARIWEQAEDESDSN